MLKLLFYQPTAALVAAPTTSLPEAVGSARNWDYRYTWIRDSAFTLYALMRLGFTDEAAGFMTWLEARCHEAPDDRGLQVLYAIDGNPQIPETTLDHLDGYKGSRPVHVGNSAAGQLQLDIYGELMDSVYLYNKYGQTIGYDLWEALGRQLDWLEKHWQLPDAGIWESRCGLHRNTYSAVMTWVAFERAQRIARQRGLPAPRRPLAGHRQLCLPDCAAAGLESGPPGLRPEPHGGNTLDASLLVMPLVKFAGPSDPRFLWPGRRGAGQLPAGLHPPRPHQRRWQPRSGAVGRAAAMSEAGHAQTGVSRRSRAAGGAAAGRHLQRAYEKLGISGRHELAGALRDQPTA
jgi:GH15 family glucan-1,4-alpha-glucosidase